MDRIHLSQGCRATTRNQFTFRSYNNLYLLSLTFFKNFPEKLLDKCKLSLKNGAIPSFH